MAGKKIFAKMEGVVITWKGERPGKDGGAKRHIVQGRTHNEEGLEDSPIFGGKADVLQSLEVGETVDLSVSISAYKEALYPDILQVHRKTAGVRAVPEKARVAV